MAITKVPFDSAYGKGELDESRITLTMPGAAADAKRICRFIHITDLHIAASRPSDSAEEVERAKQSIAFWSQFGLFRVCDADGKKRTLTTLESNEIILDRIRQLSPDGVFFTGDTVDYPSVSNFLAAKEYMDSFGVPCFMAAGNHDRIPDDSDEELASAFSLAVGKNVDFAVDSLFGIDIVRMDNGDGIITDSQLSRMRAQLSLGRPTIVLLHKPVKTESVNAPAAGTWGDDLSKWVIGFDEECKNGAELVKLLNDNRDHILSVFAGHIHLFSGGGEGNDSGEGFSPDEVLQYTAAPNFMGFLRVIDILG